MRMAEALPAPGKPTARSTAIYRNAELLYKLIESETAQAIKPYQDALDALQRQLNVAHNNNAPSIIAAELSALKAALEDSGLALVPSDGGGRPTLDFTGESGKLVSLLAANINRLSSNPEREKSLPITPATIVKVLVEGFADCQRRLDEAHTRALAETASLKKQLEERDAERTQLVEGILAEQRKVTALSIAAGRLQTQAQSLTARVMSARADSEGWKGKYSAAETERDALKRSLSTTQETLACARTDLDMWKYKCATSKDDSANLRLSQAEVDSWKTKCLQIEAELKTAREEKERGLAQLQSDLDERTAAEADLKKARDESDAKLSTLQTEVGRWRTKFLQVEAALKTALANLKTAQDEKNLHATAQATLLANTTRLEDALKTANTELADWTAKAAAWDTEGKRHKPKPRATPRSLRSSRLRSLSSRLR
ncbi:hypothetical protein B0H12DRAFT_733747 [Mycena haematopus]|nr:hypothetical protein B0H12DRAFT_733747 [Mycena haematopus]